MIYVIIAAIVFVFVLWAGISQSKAEGKQLEAMNEHIERLPDFSPALRYDNAAMALLLDPNSDQFAIATRTAGVRAYHFDQLVAVDVERNGSSLQKTNRGSQMMGAAVGGVLLGPVGLLLGGLTGSKRNEELVKRLSLKLVTSDLHTPVMEVTFFDHPQGVKPDSLLVKAAAQQLDQWHGRFRTILQGNERAAPPPPSSPPTQGEATHPGSFGRRRGLIPQG